MDDATGNDTWLGEGFFRTADQTPDAPAISIGGCEVSFAALRDKAWAIAAAHSEAEPQANGLTAILGMHTASAYAGILGALAAGNGYVPLNPKFPADRLTYVLRHSGCAAVVIDREREGMLGDVLKDIEGLNLIFADRDDVSDLQRDYPQHRVRCPVPDSTGTDRPRPAPEVPAYVLYTSGSTGTPKGVAVSHLNLRHFLDTITAMFDLRPTDRFSHLFDLSFDLSVFDMFAAWEVGACMCVPAAEETLIPTEYVRRERISVWFSVPSVAVMMQRLKQLEPGRFPDIRLSLFCGEALQWDTAGAWMAATPNAEFHNLYGPTEVTLACTSYACGENDAGDDVVPIGSPIKGLKALVANADFEDADPGETGELLIAGPQVALGYWKDADKTAQAFVTHPTSGERYYRTGDVVRRPSEANGPLRFLGRIDNQVKIRGHRIELGEIEAHLRNVSQGHRAVVLGWPVRNGQSQGLVAFVETAELDEDTLISALARNLPDYMLPKRIVAVPQFPHNVNGKIDRRSLADHLKRK
ncbi:MAG: amino acid adenylation domain-containing protein [Silicimonas sp.]|nr:amino acid adenylation domain-containing protein [Silicimonas sp.]